MAYGVLLADCAKDDIERLYRWVIERAPLQGTEWFEGLLTCLYSLDQNPNRCPLAQEARKSRRKIRNLLYGRGRSVYRILFEVNEERQTVWILHVRRGARRGVRPQDLAKPGEGEADPDVY